MKSLFSKVVLMIFACFLPPGLSSEPVNYDQVTLNMTRQIKRRILANALEVACGNKTKAARMLNISRYKLIRELNKTAGARP